MVANTVFKTISEFPAIKTIPENKIKSFNIVNCYGMLLLAFQRPSTPLRIVFTDLTLYQDYLVETRDPFLHEDLKRRLNSKTVFSVTLNEKQKLRFEKQLKAQYGISFKWDNASLEAIYKLGVVMSLEFYLKNYKDHLEGLAIKVEILDQLNTTDPVLMGLIGRVNDNFDVKLFSDKSPVVKHLQPVVQRKRPSKDILFQQAREEPLKKSARIRDPRFDTQQILFNLNYESDDEILDIEQEEVDSVGKEHEQEEKDEQEDEEEQKDEEQSISRSPTPLIEESNEQIEEESFISVITSLQDLNHLSPGEKEGKSFRLSGYFIEYPRGLKDEVLFVEKTDLKILNEANSLVLKIDDFSLVKFGRRQEVNVVKSLVRRGPIALPQYKIVLQ